MSANQPDSSRARRSNIFQQARLPTPSTSSPLFRPEYALPKLPKLSEDRADLSKSSIRSSTPSQTRLSLGSSLTSGSSPSPMSPSSQYKTDYYSQPTSRLPSGFPPSPSKRATKSSTANDSLFITKPTIVQPASDPPKQSIAPPLQPQSISPLIPEDYIDVGSQRLYMISLFVLIQTYKFYELIQLHAKNSTDAELGFAFKYLLIEGLYLWIVPVFRIPWLTFSPTVTIAQIIISSMITVFLSTTSAISLTAIFGTIWRSIYDRELSLSEGRVRAKDIVHGSDHISGRYVINILPESTAKLNPLGQIFCMNDRDESVYIPLRLNATDPKLVQVHHFSFEDASQKTLSFSKRHLKKWTDSTLDQDLGHGKITHFQIPVRSPGLYRLSKVVDSSNLDVRLYAVDVLVSNCPKAQILPSLSDRSSTKSKKVYSVDKCIGMVDTPTLVVSGVPPLRVKYSRSTKDRDSIFSVQSIQPDQFSSPLLSGAPTKNGRIWTTGETLNWGLPQTVEIGLDTALGTIGRWTYMIDEVEDGLGNVVNYSKIYERQDREESSILTSMGLSYGLLVHPRPAIRFSSCSPENPFNLARNRTVNIPLQLTGSLDEGPYEVSLSHSRSDSTLPADTLSLKMHKGLERLQVTEAGIYTIDRIHGKYCEGDVLESANCLVYTPAEPTLGVKFEDIEDKCAGSIGVMVDLTLTGTPPFELQYQTITNLGHVRTEKIRIEQTRHQLQFRPESAGHYIYEFFSLSDSLYRNIPLDRSQFRTEQTVKVLANAAFARKSERSKCCRGDSVELAVDFHGSAPFSLSYAIVHGSKRQEFMIENITESQYQFITPPLTSGGSYTAVLLSVEDGNGCKRALSQKDAVIEVRRSRPTAQFGQIDGQRKVKILKGETIALPLRLNGDAPFNIIYRRVDNQGVGSSNMSVTRNRPNGDSIMVSEEGRYEILSVYDAYCPGTVPEKHSVSMFEVDWLDRPRLELAESPVLRSVEEDGEQKSKMKIRNDVCEGDEDSLEVELYGSAPFSVMYEREFRGSTGNPKVSSFDLQAGTHRANIHMETGQSGEYTYRFKSMWDSVYDQVKVPNDMFVPIVVRQTVHPRPEAVFVNAGTVYRSCGKINSDSELEPIMVKLVGVAPWALTLNVKHETTGQSELIGFSNIKDSLYDVRKIYRSLGLGTHIVTIEEVSDGRHCIRQTPSGNVVFGSTTGEVGVLGTSLSRANGGVSYSGRTSQIKVRVADVPSITASIGSTGHDFCVGDRVSFSLTGVPPFEVEYEFNNKRQRATVSTTSFTRVASAPGIFRILSVKDAASTCKQVIGDAGLDEEGAALAEMLTKEVHEVPTVLVSEGSMITHDIHEGDRAEIVFSLAGSAPFSFTYTRSEQIGRGNKFRVLETHTVSEVLSNQYSIYTSMQGVYEAISVEDRFCRARVGA
ncbi:uncharacterized protein V1516DRAFT_678824 [Lipomyces oligophaga]|uniref:uncharacterized protein n=1 Tax=Lipomyces oligophaga TaxID=45792 RepID=UPI0034CF77D4